MRLLMTFIIFASLAVSQSFADDEPGSAVNTDDICEARPDLCGGSHKRTKKKRSRSTTSVKKKKKTEAQNVNDEAFNDFFSDDENEAAPRPKKETPAAPAATASAGAVPAPRQPASLEPKAQRRRISFSEYMNANANHPVLNLRRSQFQDAFPNVNRPATYMTTTAPESPRAAAAPANGAAPAAAPASPPAPAADSAPAADMATGN